MGPMRELRSGQLMLAPTIDIQFQPRTITCSLPTQAVSGPIYDVPLQHGTYVKYDVVRFSRCTGVVVIR